MHAQHFAFEPRVDCLGSPLAVFGFNDRVGTDAGKPRVCCLPPPLACFAATLDILAVHQPPCISPRQAAKRQQESPVSATHVTHTCAVTKYILRCAFLSQEFVIQGSPHDKAHLLSRVDDATHSTLDIIGASGVHQHDLAARALQLCPGVCGLTGLHACNRRDVAALRTPHVGGSLHSQQRRK